MQCFYLIPIPARCPNDATQTCARSVKDVAYSCDDHQREFELAGYQLVAEIRGYDLSEPALRTIEQVELESFGDGTFEA